MNVTSHWTALYEIRGHLFLGHANAETKAHKTKAKTDALTNTNTKTNKHEHEQKLKRKHRRKRKWKQELTYTRMLEHMPSKLFSQRGFIEAALLT